MPSVLIEVRKQYPVETEMAIMEAVHLALRECFKILPNDRNVRLLVHKPHRFNCPSDRESPELYTHISIDCFAGRSIDTKRILYKTIVKNLEIFGIPNNHASRNYSRKLGHQGWACSL